jgi:hypothetical protein
VLNNAYSQRQISTIYDSLNQYQVVLEINPKYAWDPSTLKQVQVITADGARVPLSTIARYENSLANDRVSHEGQFASEDISFDVAEGYSPDQARLPGARGGQGGPAGVDRRSAAPPMPSPTTEGPAADDPRRAGAGVPGAGHSVRELHSPADHSVDLPSAGVGALLRCT